MSRVIWLGWLVRVLVFDKSLFLISWLFMYICLLIKITVCKTDPISRIFESTNRFHTGYSTIENVNTIDERRSNFIRNRVLDCHLSPDWRQMVIKNTDSSDF